MTRRAIHAAACGGRVRVTKAFLEHQAAYPVDTGHLAEAIAATRLPPQGKLVAEVDLGRVVGRSHRVSTERVGLDDPILAARRIGRLHPSRVVVGVEPEPTHHVTFVVTRSTGIGYVLVTAFYGTSAQPEPLDIPAAERERSLSYWMGEALIWMPGLYEGPPFRTTWARMVSGLWAVDARDRP